MNGAQPAIGSGVMGGAHHAGELPSWLPPLIDASLLDQFIIEHIPRVYRLARKMARRLPSHVEIDDLVSAGTLGLVDAARRFDPEVCSRFEAFADHRIRGAMLDELRAHDCLSRDLRARCKRRAEAVTTLEHALGRPPSSEEVAEELGIDIEDYLGLVGRVHRGQTASAEALTRDGSGAQAFEDKDIPDPCEVAMARQLRDLLARAIEALPDRLGHVTSMYYKDGLTLAAIGETLGVTEARACQLRGEAVRRIRETLAEWDVASA